MSPGDSLRERGPAPPEGAGLRDPSSAISFADPAANSDHGADANHTTRCRVWDDRRV